MVDNLDHFFATLGIRKPEAEVPVSPSGESSRASGFEFTLDLENPAYLGHPRWSTDASEDKNVYNQLLHYARESEIEDEWKRALIQASVLMTTTLAPQTMKSSIVSRAQKKALVELDTFVSTPNRYMNERECSKT